MPRPPAAATDEAREKGLTTAYGKATTRLREAHLDEFNKYRVEESKKLGFEWAPKLTPEKKAEKELDDLLEKYPHLRQKFEPVPEPDDEDTPPDPDAS